MLRNLPRAAIKKSAEVGVSLVAVLASFLAMIGLLSWSFPQGQSLAQLMSNRQATLQSGQDANWVFTVGNDGRRRSYPVIAELTRMQHRVKDKLATAIAWSDSTTGLPLRDRHSIQTYTNSGATISFSDRTRVDLRENSLIVLRAPTGKAVSRSPSLVILGGELSATLGGTTGDGFEIVMPNGTVQINGDAEADARGQLRVALGKDSTSTITVLNGVAQIMTETGTRRVPANEALTIRSDGSFGAIVSVPAPPRPQVPDDNLIVAYRVAPPPIRFDWIAPPEVNGYRLEIAYEAEFENLVYDGRIDEAQFEHGNLHDGTYYWRVISMTGEVAGPPSETRVLQTRQDLEPPLLSVAFPEGPVGAEMIVLRGNTEAGSRLFITDTEVTLSSEGTFETDVKLRRGVNVVVVESIDAAGNVSYESHLITANY